MTTGYVKELEYVEKAPPEQFKNSGKVTETQPFRTSTDTVGEVMEIHWWITLNTRKVSLQFLHNFYPKPKVDLKDNDISQETRQKLLTLQQNYDDIVSKHSSDIRLTHLEGMKIDTDPNLPPVASKPFPLPLKHHNEVKEEIENLLEAGLIENLQVHMLAPL